MEGTKKFIRIHEKDNVAIAIQDIKKDESVELDGVEYTAQEDIPRGHKMALRDFKDGDVVIKYGNNIGVTSADVPAGSWVHTQNMHTGLSGKIEYSYNPVPHEKVNTEGVRDTFMGYRRADGSVGIRNEIWVIPTVSCVNHAAKQIAEAANEKFGDSCDGIFALPHNAGCSQMGNDHITTQKILASIIKHPNAGGVLLVSLGCEENNLERFLPVLGEFDHDRIKYMIAQEADDEVETGTNLIKQIVSAVSKDKREPVSVSELKIGFKCGGSDSLSGVTANPLCGKITDRVTAMGGTSILTEVPEMFGAEHILMNRADSQETFEKIVSLINDFKQYYMDYNQPIYENPAPGNKAGGITTLEEKSLGCIQKGGHALVTDTLAYGQHAEKKGLNLMNGPGNDSVSITNLLASGAQIILFTTGRGNPLGTAVPSVKIATNVQLYSHKTHWFDFNAGTLIYDESMEEMCDRLWNLVLDIASGEQKARNEINGYKDIMIFKNGVLL